MPWLYLTFAILLEVAGTICLKLSDGFANLAPSLAIIPFYGASLGFLVLALKALPVSVAYAIWSAVGTALVASIGILWFREPATVLRLASLALIILGVIGLNLAEHLENGG